MKLHCSRDNSGTVLPPILIKERLHRRLAEAPASLMWPQLVVFADPNIKNGLQLVDGTVHLFAERDAVKLIEHGLVEALTDAVALGLSPRVIDVLDREIELILSRPSPRVR